MATTQEYALLSLYVYNVANKVDNRPSLANSGWTPLEIKNDDLFGFSYGVFRGPGGEIVVSYTGTNENVDWASNIGNGLGIGSPQATAAAMVYQQVRDQYGPNITFTGHSLGAGLASIMSVWFDRPAVVFDEAPFELLARNPLLVLATKATLAATGRDLGAFLGYNELLNFATREQNVQGHYLEGEALQIARAAWPTISASQTPLAVGGSGLGAVQLHSMALYTAAKLSPAFAQATFTSARILPLAMDGTLYGFDTGTSTQKNFLIDLLRSEQATPGNGKLTHFAADLNKLGTNISGLNQAAQDALIAQGIEWYYWQGTDYAGQEFFTQTGESLQYTTALGAGLAGAQNKAADYAGKWLTPIVKDHGESYSVSFARDYDQWNIATGSAGASLTALKSDKSQIFIGAGGGDTFTGGDLNDVMFAGAGADTLNSGGGNDELYGGAGNDTLRGGAGYDIYRIEGDDTIEDSDGVGSIRNKTGQRITGAVEKRSDGSYGFLGDSSISVTGGADLTLTLADGSGVTIKNFKDGDLGLNLNDTAATPETNRTILGDLAPVDFDPNTSGVQSRRNDLDSVIVDPNQPRANRPDYLYDSAGNDIVIGAEGMDLLRGDAGDDKIYAASGIRGDFIDSSGDDIFGDMGTNELQNGMSDGVSSSKWRWPDAWSLVRLHSIPNRARKIRTLQDRLAEHVCCQFKSRIRGHRSCRTRKATVRGHVPGHGSPFPGASRNEVIQ